MPTREGDLTTVEVSELLRGRLSPDSVARTIRTGKMEGYQLAGRWFTNRQAVETYQERYLGHKGWTKRKGQGQTGAVPDQEG